MPSSNFTSAVKLTQVGRGVCRSYYKGHKDKIKGGGQRWGREVGLAGVGWRDGEKMQTIVTE